MEEVKAVLKKFIEKEKERSDAKNIDNAALLECAKWCRLKGKEAMRSTNIVCAWKISQAYFAMADKLEIATLESQNLSKIKTIKGEENYDKFCEKRCF